ncbi:MAG TPA: ABC transporter substrate-binding protein [Albitalea sp.]|uniref:ABC transporter substrate-binding protein n=1 Tax=Piscinibacter sp. TaxID=1903157 RepID=UPI002ED2AF51
MAGSPAFAAPPPPKLAMQIGAFLPESWDKARGEEMRNGMLLAIKTWPGQPAPTLVVKDDACDPKKAAAAAQELADAKVDVVVGGFCALGVAPRILAEAGLPFVSANAVRFAPAADSAVQFASVPQSMPGSIGFKLRSDLGLKVSFNSSCWVDFEQHLADGFDAALCPTLHVDKARWAEIAPTYAAAYRKPFTTAAARGYAAMQVALAAIKQMRAGSKPANAFKDAREVDTMLGKVRFREEAPPPGDAMQLILSPKLPRLAPRDAAALDDLMKSKGCGCTKGSDCPQDKAWSSMPFVLASCAPGSGSGKR